MAKFVVKTHYFVRLERMGYSRESCASQYLAEGYTECAVSETISRIFQSKFNIELSN